MHESHVVDVAHVSVVPVVQTPASQESPEQQSALVTHVCEAVRHAHVPPEHSIQPQHSELDVHVRPGSEQHSVEVGLARQLRPVQHDAAVVHAVPAVVHIAVVRPHMPPMQLSPPPHAVPVVQHGCPSPPHVGIAHAPRVHAPVHRLPHIPQLRASVDVSMQEPEQHMVPVPVHAVPVVQHASPVPPQRVIVMLHVPPEHESPASQRVPPQHGCRAPPHAAAVSQSIPGPHVSPAAQSPPSQHGCRDAPHAAVAAHTARSHTSPAAHANPSQHVSRSWPHVASAAHMPVRQTSPVEHASPAQHGCPSRPHAATLVHVPDEHVRPGSQRLPMQQASRLPPQPAGVAASRMTGPPASIPTTPPSPRRPASMRRVEVPPPPAHPDPSDAASASPATRVRNLVQEPENIGKCCKVRSLCRAGVPGPWGHGTPRIVSSSGADASRTPARPAKSRRVVRRQVYAGAPGVREQRQIARTRASGPSRVSEPVGASSAPSIVSSVPRSARSSASLPSLA